MSRGTNWNQRAARATEAGSLAVATVAFGAFLVVSSLAASPNADQYGFKNSTGAISSKFVTQVTPANFTFAIWGVIFIWQSAWLVYAWTVFRPEAVRTISISVYQGFAAGSAVNIVWLYLFGNELINLSELFLVAFNVVIYITTSAFAFYFYANMSTARKMDVLLTRVLVLNGLSLYAAWTTIAFLLNTSIVMQYTFGLDPSTVGTVTLSLLTAALLLYFTLENTVLAQYARDVFTVYPVVIWALIGILDKHWGKPGEGQNTIYTLVLLIGTVALVVLRSGLLVVFYHFRRASHRKQTPV